MECVPVVTELEETLVDWFETIEEMELTEADKALLASLAETLADLKKDALTQGIQSEDFDDWLNFDILENWSILHENDEDAADNPDGNTVPAFDAFIREGEQRLYFQMLKRCLPVVSQTA